MLPDSERIHDHSSPKLGGDTLDPRLVQVSQTLTVGPSIAGTGLQTALSVDGAILAGLKVIAPTLDLVAAASVVSSGTQNNYAPGTAWGFIGTVRFAPSAALTITGLDSAPGAITFGQSAVLLLNTDNASSITLKHQNAGSTAANRIICPNAADYVIPPLGAVLIYRDTQTQRWRVVDIGAATFTLPDHTHGATGDGGNGLVPNNISLTGPELDSGIFDAGVISAAQNDIAIGAVRIAKWSPTGATRALNGMVAAGPGHRVTIVNYSTTNILNVNHENVGSAAANRLLCAGAATYALNFTDAVEAWYDSSVSRWRVIGH
jgi:hypothetical protein